MDADAGGFDLSAAYLRRAQGDSKAFVEGLAARLEGALPGAVSVERRRDGLFSSERHVVKITVALDRCILVLTLEKGRLQARRSKVVRGVTIGSEDVTVPAWLEALTQEIGATGGQAEAARSVLHDFLLS